MKLLDYMKQHGISDEALAERIGSVTSRAVKKWKYRETSPRIAELVRLEEVTGGLVCARDFLPDAAHPAPVSAEAAE